MKGRIHNLPTIKHIVIAGGAHLGLSYYGALRTLIQKNIISLSNVETMYTTSVGSIVAITILLGYDWITIDSYLVNRPWSSVFKFDFPTLFKSLSKGGIYDISVFKEIMSPILLGKDLSLDITLEQFYKYSNTELHFITTDYKDLNLCDISYKTHPEWSLIDAIYATSCLPVAFVPFKTKTGETFIDGAINMNYPIDKCLNDGHSKENLIGISHSSSDESSENALSYYETIIENDTSSFKLLFFIIDLFLKLWYRIRIPTSEEAFTSPYQLHIQYKENDKRDDILQCIKSKDVRENLINIGVSSANVFIETFEKEHNSVD